MKLFVPFTKLNPATQITLWDFDPEFIKITGKYGYSKFFKERWEKDDFINVEHDVIVWPGAIQSLIECAYEWCAFDYTTGNWSTQEAQLNSIPLGCMKFTNQVMKILRSCWDKPIDWHYCDSHLFQFARSIGLFPHQHFPGVINANLAFLDRRRI